MFTEKILCLGNNDQSTDDLVSERAKSCGTCNHGLIIDTDFKPSEPGYYHTTVLDMPYGSIIRLAQHFDRVELLDQPRAAWSNWKPFLSTVKIMRELEGRGYHVEYRNNANVCELQTLDEFLNNNPSFCIYPWINWAEENGKLSLCVRAEIGRAHV